MVSKMLVDRKITFAQHVSRFAIGDRETHLVKQLLMWRPLKWWRHQQESIKAGEDFFVHPVVGKKARWENQFGANWINEYSKQAIEQVYRHNIDPIA